jgi:hypothetical protein
LIDQSIHEPVPDEYVAENFKPGEKYCTEIHSHEHLDSIFATLWDPSSPVLKRGSFCDLVFRLIFFHQSLHGVDLWPPMVMASVEERLKYCDPEFFSLAVILMSNDSGSYTFLTDRALHAEAAKKFRESSEMMIEEWQ